MSTAKSGTISGAETWGDTNNPGPILLTGDATIAPAAVVRVLPGTEVQAQGPYKLRIEGALLAGGLRRGRVVFRSDSGVRGGWSGIEWAHAGILDSVLQYVDVQDAMVGLKPVVATAGPRLKAIRSRLENCDQGAGGTVASLYLEKVTAIANRVGISSSGSWGLNSVIDCRIRKNEIGIDLTGGTLTLTNQRNRVYDNAVAGVQTAGGSALLAAGVWWGSDTGPTNAAVPAGTGDKVTGTGTLTLTPQLELARYVPRPETLRTFCDKILKEIGTAGIESLETTLDDDDIEEILDRAQGVVDSWHADVRLEKPLFARGTETNEEVDTESVLRSYAGFGRWPGGLRYLAGGHYLRTRYRPIRAVATVERRTGATTWTALTNDEAGGWFASQEMMRRGEVRVSLGPSYRLSSYRLTYDHGYDDMPDEIRDAVVKVAALELFHAILLPGAADTYALRTQPLRDEVKSMESRVRGRKIGWAVS